MTNERPKRKAGATAGELLDELEKDPAYIARMQESERRAEENRRRYGEAAAGMLADLRAIGFDVSTAQELLAWGRRYRPAVPVLLEWFPKVSYGPLKADIARTLCTPWAQPPAGPTFVEWFRTQPEKTDPTDLRWIIGLGLQAMADESLADDMIDLAVDKGYGEDRAQVVEGLAKIAKYRPQVEDLLIDLVSDPDVASSAVIALGKLKSQRARSAIEPFLQHPDSWVRDKARRALVKIDKAAAKNVP